MGGMNRVQDARIGGMDRPRLSDWFHRFNERGADGLKDMRSKGLPPRPPFDQLAALASVVETKPRPGRRWRGALAAHRSAKGRPRALLRRLLRARNRQTIAADRLSPSNARPHHPAQDAREIEAFKQASRPR